MVIGTKTGACVRGGLEEWSPIKQPQTLCIMANPPIVLRLYASYVHVVSRLNRCGHSDVLRLASSNEPGRLPVAER